MTVEILPLLEEEARKRQGHGLTAPGKTLREKIPNGKRVSQEIKPLKLDCWLKLS
jgi:hypothetical protein